ncbi:GNAT family N-acetyltransferase [Acetobacter musti]
MHAPDSHPLNRPVWSALTGRQSDFASDFVSHAAGHLKGSLRFRTEVSPLAAAGPSGSDISGSDMAALRNLAGEGEELWFLEKTPPPVPPGMTLLRETECVQMTACSITAGANTFHAVPLGEADAEDMLALATLTAPGPFRHGTWRLGGFIGIREEGRLVAMAGERTKPGEFCEVSGVCTHPDFRGRGYAGFLMREVASAILARGETPFLHCYATNHGAIALYRTLGFTPFQSITASVIRRDP